VRIVATCPHCLTSEAIWPGLADAMRMNYTTGKNFCLAVCSRFLAPSLLLSIGIQQFRRIGSFKELPMNTKKTAATSTHDLFQRWQFEDHELAARIDETRKWMQQVAERGTPRFGEAGSQLTQLRSYLLTHFDREHDICDQLENLYDKHCPEIEAMRRQATHDHQQLLNQLDEFIAKLNALDPPFVSWQAAIEQVESFADTLEQHEEQESESILALTACE